MKITLEEIKQIAEKKLKKCPGELHHVYGDFFSFNHSPALGGSPAGNSTPERENIDTWGKVVDGVVVAYVARQPVSATWNAGAGGYNGTELSMWKAIQVPEWHNRFGIWKVID